MFYEKLIRRFYDSKNDFLDFGEIAKFSVFENNNKF